MAVPGQVVRRVGEVCGRGLKLTHDVADDAPVLDDALEEGGPAHEVGEIEGEVVVFREGVEVAEVEVQEVGGGDAADGGHGEGEVVYRSIIVGWWT